MANTTPIEQYAFLGDQRTAALVSREGSIDWLCLPNFDSPACFAAILGEPEHGRWLISPVRQTSTTRRYLPGTLILETIHETATGKARVIDLMTAETARADVLRRVEGLEGSVEFAHEWIVRPWYGKRIPWQRRESAFGQDVVRAIAGPSMFVLRGPDLPDGDAASRFTVTEGQVLDFDMSWQPSHEDMAEHTDIDSAMAATIRRTNEWLDMSHIKVDYSDAVRTSLLVLKHLTDAETGGMVAAPTASLPEAFGGGRNWDYRYTWLRDAALVVETLVSAGYRGKTKLWRDWLLRAIAGDPAGMQIMYRVDGSHHLPEAELDHLPGYRDSRPVRIGNGAVDQRQMDVLGEVMVALEMAREAGIDEDIDSWGLQQALVDDMVGHWQEPDEGIWEIRGPRRHFTHSRVMVWAALDRAIRAAEKHKLPGDVDRWRRIAQTVREEVLDRGFCEETNSFRQHYDTDEVDASLLLLPAVGFIDAEDERFVGTVARIEQDLMRDGLILRYRTESGVDGLDGEEHPFLICNFWLVSAYARMGRAADAYDLMDRLVGLSNDVGLLAEEADAEGIFYGNFPQAFSHLGLVSAAMDLHEFVGSRPDSDGAGRPSLPLKGHR